MDKNSSDIKVIKTLFVIVILIGVAVAGFVLWLSTNPRTIQSNNIQYVGQGMEGKSAYETARLHGYIGTEKEWIASLNGKNGTTTIINKEEKTVVEVPAPPAPRGDAGLSAYDIWIEQGNSGTKQDFLDSLIPNVVQDVRLYRLNEITNKLESKLQSEFFWSPVPSCGVTKPCL